MNLSFLQTENTLSLLLDGEVLFEKKMFWVYVRKKDNNIYYEQFKLNDKYLNVFFDDIQSQLDSGVDRNELTLNIPKEVQFVYVGEKLIKIVDGKPIY